MNHRAIASLCAVVIFTFITSSVPAATIVAETGRDSRGYEARTDAFTIASWSQTNSYQDVRITARLYSVATDDHGMAYLMKQIGPGTTAADEAAKASFQFPAGFSPSTVLIFSNLTLSAGTYYLIITGGTNYWSAWYSTDQPTITTDSGVTHNGDAFVFQPAAYPPASPYRLEPEMHFIFSVTGYGIGENRPPVANAGLDQQVECSGTTTRVVLDGRQSSDPDGDSLTYAWWEGTMQLGASSMLNVDLSTGLHEVRLVVTDGAGHSAEDTVLIDITDGTAPFIRASASPAILWPPNGKMVPVVIRTEVRDLCDANATARIIGVESDEPAGRLPDWEITGELTLNLRARRSGRGDGKTYRVTVEASDSSGNKTTTKVSVVVPH